MNENNFKRTHRMRIVHRKCQRSNSRICFHREQCSYICLKLVTDFAGTLMPRITELGYIKCLRKYEWGDLVNLRNGSLRYPGDGCLEGYWKDGFEVMPRVQPASGHTKQNASHPFNFKSRPEQMATLKNLVQCDFQLVNVEQFLGEIGKIETSENETPGTLHAILSSYAPNWNNQP